jgi:hypothetical protein
MNFELGSRFASALQLFVNNHTPPENAAIDQKQSRRRNNPHLLQVLLDIDETLHPHDLTAMRILYVQSVTPGNVVNLTILVNQVLLLVAPNVNTRDTFMSQTRKSVREQEGEESKDWKDMCMSLILKPECRTYKRRHAHRRLVEKNANQMMVNFEDIQKAIMLMNSGNDIIQQITLLQLCCGARMIEVLRVSTFSSIPNNEHHILVKGTAKSREVKTFVRPLLFLTPKRFIELANKIQSHVNRECTRLNMKTRAQISRHFNKTVNDTLRGIIPGFTSHRCRELYANLSWNLLCPSHVSLTKWICDVLGHDPEFLASALHYQGIRVTGLPDYIHKQMEVTPQIQLNDLVTLKAANNASVSLERHNVLRDGQSQSYLDQRVRQLKQKDIPVTNINLRRLGFGGSTIQTYRQQQRNLKRSRDESVEYVQVKDRDGSWHPIAKKPKLRDGRTLQRIGEIRYQLCCHNIEPTNRVLRSLGISARSLKQFRLENEDTIDPK